MAPRHRRRSGPRRKPNESSGGQPRATGPRALSIAARLVVGSPHHDRRRTRRFARNRPVAGRVLDVDEEGREVGRIGQTRDLATERPDEEAFRSEEHTSELQSLMRISYAVFFLKK